MTRLKIDNKRAADVVAYRGNARKHGDDQIKRIAESINEFGFNNPILVDENDTVVAGHARLEAAKLLGLKTVPTICLGHMSEAQKRAYILADNRLAERASWDEEILISELEALLNLEIDFDIETIGFDGPEIDVLLSHPPSDQEQRREDEDLVLPNGPPTSRPGDLWILGKHKLLCGNALEPESFELVLGDEFAQMVFTDPPYNVPINGHVTGNGRTKHTEFAMASGEMDDAAFGEFLETALGNLSKYSVDGSLHFVCMDWRHMATLLKAGSGAYTELKNLCIWNKTNGGMGSLYRSKHELVFLFKSGRAGHINNVELGVHGRYRTNVWDYPGVNTFREGRLDDLAAHPTVKPIGMIADAILDCSSRGGIVLDPFIGSGTTILAAEQTGRLGRGIELDPGFVDVSIRRWEAATGKSAVLAETKMTFVECGAVRQQSREGQRHA